MRMLLLFVTLCIALIACANVVKILDVAADLAEPTADQAFAQQQLEAARANLEYWERWNGLRE
jgi:hypothetical protein